MSRKAGGAKKSVKFSPEENLAKVKVIENEDDMLLTTTNSPLKANSDLGQRIKKLSPVTGALESQETKLAFERLLKQASESMFDDDEDEEDGGNNKAGDAAVAKAILEGESSPTDNRDAVARKLNIRTDSSHKEGSAGTPATPTNRLETYVNSESPVLLTDMGVKSISDGKEGQAADAKDDNNNNNNYNNDDSSDDDDGFLGNDEYYDDDSDDDLPSWAAKPTDKNASKNEVLKEDNKGLEKKISAKVTAEVETKESEPIKAVTMDKVMSPSQEELAARMRISQERVALQREQTRMEISRLEDQFRKYNINFQYSPGTEDKSYPNSAGKSNNVNASTVQASSSGSPMSSHHEDGDEVVMESQSENASSTTQAIEEENNQRKDKSGGNGKGPLKGTKKKTDVPIEKDGQKERDGQKALDFEKRMKATKQKKQEELRSSIEKEKKSKDEEEQQLQDQKLLDQRKSLFASPTSEQNADHSKDISRDYDEDDSAISSSAQAILAAYSNSMQSTSVTTDMSINDASESITTTTTNTTTITRDMAIGTGLPMPITGANMGLDLGQGIGSYGTWYSETYDGSSSMMTDNGDNKGSGGGMDLLDLMKEVQSRRSNTQSESTPTESVQTDKTAYADSFNKSLTETTVDTETKMEVAEERAPVIVVDAAVDGQESSAEQVHHKDKHTKHAQKHDKHPLAKDEKYHAKEHPNASHHNYHRVSDKSKHHTHHQQHASKHHASHSTEGSSASTDTTTVATMVDSHHQHEHEQSLGEVEAVNGSDSPIVVIDEDKIVDDLAGIENANKHLQYYTEYLHQFEKEFYRYFKEYDGVQATTTTDDVNNVTNENSNSETGQEADSSKGGDHVKSIDDIVREKKARLLKLQAFSFDELEAQVLQKHQELAAAEVIF